MRKIKTAVPLTDLKKGSTGTVKEINAGWDRKRKLFTLGIFPGEQVTLVQKNPVLLLKLGYSFVAVDHSLGKTIKVIEI